MQTIDDDQPSNRLPERGVGGGDWKEGQKKHSVSEANIRIPPIVNKPLLARPARPGPATSH